jgi:hypothetical protein
MCPVRPWAKVRVHEVRIESGGVWIRRAEPEPPPPTEPPPDDDLEWLRWDPDRYFKKN